MRREEGFGKEISDEEQSEENDGIGNVIKVIFDQSQKEQTRRKRGKYLNTSPITIANGFAHKELLNLVQKYKLY